MICFYFLLETSLTTTTTITTTTTVETCRCDIGIGNLKQSTKIKKHMFSSWGRLYLPDSWFNPPPPGFPTNHLHAGFPGSLDYAIAGLVMSGGAERLMIFNADYMTTCWILETDGWVDMQQEFDRYIQQICVFFLR